MLKTNQKSVKTDYVLTEDRKKIYYNHYIQSHEKVIVLAHGFYNSKDAVLFKDMAGALNDEYDVIVMDFRGHGQSDGPFHWTAKEHQDLEAILTYAHQDYAKIGVVGFSLGAAASIITASQSELITSLIAVSPPTQFKKIEFHFWKMSVMENIIYNVFQEGRIGKGIRPGNLWLKKTKPIDVVDKIKAPILFVHGTKDWLVLPWHSKKLYEKARNRKRLEIVENGTHGEYLFRRDRSGMIQLFKEWFKRTL